MRTARAPLAVARLGGTSARAKLRRSQPLLLWALLLGVVLRLTVFIRQRAAGDTTTVDSFALVQILMVGLALVVAASSRQFSAAFR
jgi:hypothetical protein